MRGIALWQLINFARQPRPGSKGPPIKRMLDQVRQLVLLAEERDLRHIPPAAAHMNAVRLLTVHGAKGLEFDAVHVPGLTKGSFPSPNRAPPFPIPPGLVDTASAAEPTQGEEEECLFFVAMSRARTHLRLFRVTKQANGNARNPSEFLEGLPLRAAEIRPLPAPAGSGDRSFSVKITWPQGHVFRVKDVESFKKCAQRYFYGEVLGLPRASKRTPFAQTYSCLMKLIDWMLKLPVHHAPSEDETRAALTELWTAHGPNAHAFADQYWQVAVRIAGVLSKRALAGRRREATSLAVRLASGTVVVDPDLILEMDDGTVVLRHIRLGHRRSNEKDALIYALYRIGARLVAPNARVEAIHLTEERPEELIATEETTERVFKSRTEEANGIVAKLGAGPFAPEADAFACPRCPHFFVCAAVPEGPLDLSVESDPTG
jgi:DNA helicase-2/ATP-dependent DNA helicase PcrA